MGLVAATERFDGPVTNHCNPNKGILLDKECAESPRRLTLQAAAWRQSVVYKNVPITLQLAPGPHSNPTTKVSIPFAQAIGG